MTIASLQDLKSDYHVYEDIVFEKIKEGVYFAASHLFATSGLIVGSGVLALKAQGVLYTTTPCVFLSAKRANAKVQKLRDSLRTLTEESKNSRSFLQMQK